MAKRRWPGRSDFWIIFCETSTTGWIESRRCAWKFGKATTDKRFAMRRVGRLRRSSRLCCIFARIRAVCKENQPLLQGKVQYRPASRNGKSGFFLPVRASVRTDWQHAVEALGQHFRRRRYGSVRGPAKARFYGERGFLLRVQWIRARWSCQRMAPGFAPGAGPIAEHAPASMAQPYSHSESASRRDCAAGDRNLALCDAVRIWIHFAVNDPGSRCGAIPGLSASQACQSWVAYYFHGRSVWLLPDRPPERIQRWGHSTQPHVVSISAYSRRIGVFTSTVATLGVMCAPLSGRRESYIDEFLWGRMLGYGIVIGGPPHRPNAMPRRFFSARYRAGSLRSSAQWRTARPILSPAEC